MAKRFEHWARQIHEGDLRDIIREMENEGYELIAVCKENFSYTLFFKRPV